MYLRLISAALTVALILTMSGCAAKSELVSISVQPATVMMSAAGQTVQLTATGTYTHGQHPETTRDITNQVQWSSPAPEVVTVSNTGLVTAVGSGMIPITATMNTSSGPVTGAANVTSSAIPPAPRDLISLTIIPSSQPVTVLGEPTQFIAIGTFSSDPITQDLTTQATWQSSDVEVAPINSAGLALANSTGQTTITAIATSAGGNAISASALLTVASASGGVPLPALTLSQVGLGSGAVTSSPPGINCGSGAGCTASFPSGTSVLLTATPAPGSIFGGWSANCTPATAPPTGGTCTVVMNNNEAVGAIFDLGASATLQVVFSGAGTGVVTSVPAGINCGPTCSAGFVSGTSVTLTAMPNSGSSFGQWTGCDSTAGQSCTVLLNTSRTVTVTLTTP